jgi:hypothetical protein|nr:MAG TPA: hypothetical protein [Caudoviricetes sp.]
MSNNDWPVGPIIRVRRATAFGGFHIRDAYAIRDAGGDYLVDGEALLRDAGDRIYEWEEVTAVPTAALKHLRHVFLGVELPLTQFAAIQQVVSHLSANKPSALDRAVTRVKDVADTPMVDAETLPAECLSLLLDALASVQSAARKTSPLTMVTRICADWVQADNPEKIALEQMQSRALSIPEVVGSDPARFIVLAGYIGDAANMLSEAHLDTSGQLTNAGTYALAWAAQIIEEEDK